MATRDIQFQISTKIVGPALKDTFDSSAKAAKEAAKATAVAMKEIEKATSSAKKAAEDYQKVSGEGSKNVAEGAKKVAEGFLGIGRAIGLAGVATSKDMEQAIRMFAKFQAGADVFKGVLDLVEGGRKVWQTYVAISKAAAAADLAAATAAKVRSVASAGSGVASAAGAVAGSGVASAAAGPLVSAVAPIVAALGPLGLALAAFGVAIAAIWWFSDDGADKAKQTAEHWKEALKEADEMGEWRKKDNAIRKAALAEQAQQGEIEAYRGGRQGLDERLSKNRLEDARRRLGAATAHDSAAQAWNGKGSSDGENLELADNAANAAKELHSAQQAMIEAEKARWKEQESLLDKELQTAKDKAKEERDGLKAVQDKTKQEQDKLKSAQERFVEADPLERQKALKALEQAKAGGDLTNEQRASLKNYGLHDELVAKDTQRRVDALSPQEKEFFKGQESKISDLKKKEADLEGKIKQADDKVKELTNALDELPKQLAEAIAPYVGKMGDKLRRELELESNAKETRDRANARANATG